VSQQGVPGNPRVLGRGRVGDYDDAAWQKIDWSQHSHDAVVCGRRVHYVDIGNGPAVVLVHGQGASWQWWLRVLPKMVTKTRTIALDLPGFGDSDSIINGDIFDEHAATINGVLDHLGLKSATIVGHSMGGLGTLRVARNHPDRVVGIVLVNSGGAPVGAVRLFAFRTVFVTFYAISRLPWVLPTIARTPYLPGALLTVAVADPRSLSPALTTRLITRLVTPGFVSTLKAGTAEVRRATVEEVQCPSLVIWGTKDQIVPVSQGKLLATKLSDARFVPIEGVGHCPMIEAPGELSDLITGFARDVTRIRPDTDPDPDPCAT